MTSPTTMMRFATEACDGAGELLAVKLGAGEERAEPGVVGIDALLERAG